MDVWPTVVAAKVILAGENETGPTPVPDTLNSTGLIVLLLDTETLPLFDPVPVGENVTWNVHLALTGKEPEHGVVPPGTAAKLLDAVRPEIVTAEVPLFVTVTVEGALVVPASCPVLNVKAAGLKLSVEAAPLPVPDKFTITAGKLPDMVSDPLMLPFCEGLNVTL